MFHWETMASVMMAMSVTHAVLRLRRLVLCQEMLELPLLMRLHLPPLMCRHNRQLLHTIPDVDHLKGRLKKSAKDPPSECRGNAAPTDMDDEGWIKISIDDLSAAQGCPVNKARAKPGRRRLTGGMQTFMLQCGLIVDFMELYKGESLQLVYATLLTLVVSLVLAAACIVRSLFRTIFSF